MYELNILIHQAYKYTVENINYMKQRLYGKFFLPCFFSQYIIDLIAFFAFGQNKELEFILLFYIPVFSLMTLKYSIRIIKKRKQIGDLDFLFSSGLRKCSFYLGQIISSFFFLYSQILFTLIMTFLIYLLIYKESLTLIEYYVVCIYYFCYSFGLTGQMLFLSVLGGRLKKRYFSLKFIFHFSYIQALVHLQDKNVKLKVTPQQILFYFIHNQFYLEERNYKNILDDLIFFCISGSVYLIIYLMLDYSTYRAERNVILITRFFIEKLRKNRSYLQLNLNTTDIICTEKEEIIVFESVSKCLNLEKIQNLNMKIYQDQLNWIIGDQKSGINIIMKLILGLIEVDEGSLQYKNIIESQSKYQQKIFYVNQFTNFLLNQKTIEQNLYYLASFSETNQNNLKIKVNQALFFFRLLNKKQKIFEAGDQIYDKINVLLAISWLLNQKVIICDLSEISNQDQRIDIIEMMLFLKQDRCIIIIDQYPKNLEINLLFIRQLTLIKQGQLIMQGKIEEINKYFCVGYNLIIKLKQRKNKGFQLLFFDKIIKKVSDLFMDSFQVRMLDQQQLLIILQFETKDRITTLLQYIESIQEIQFSFETQTLTQAYERFQTNEQKQIQLDQSINEVIFDIFEPKNKLLKQIKSLFLRRYWIEKQRKWQYLIFTITEIIYIILYFNTELKQLEEIYYFYYQFKILTIYQLQNCVISDLFNLNKNLLLTYGASLNIYWCANFLFDALANLIYYMIVLFFIFLIQFQGNIPLINLYFYFTFVNFLWLQQLICLSYLIIQIAQIESRFIKKHIECFLALYLICNYFFNKNVMIQDLFYALFENKFPSVVKKLIQEATLTLLFIILLFLLNKYDFKREIRQLNFINQQLKTKLGKNSLKAFGIFGPIGAGKTTICHNLSLINSPQSCSSCQERKQGWLNSIYFQPFKLHQKLTFEQYLRIFGLLQGRSEENIDNIIDKYINFLNLQQIRHKQCQELSDSEQKLILLAIAFISDKAQIILDEPTEGLDSISKAKIQQLILQNKFRKQIVITTKSFNDIENICDEFGILVNYSFLFMGRLLELQDNFFEMIQLTFKFKYDGSIFVLQNLIYQRFGEDGIQKNSNTYWFHKESCKMSYLFNFCISDLVQEQIEDFQIVSLEKLKSVDFYQQKYVAYNDQ